MIINEAEFNDLMRRLKAGEQCNLEVAWAMQVLWDEIESLRESIAELEMEKE